MSALLERESRLQTSFDTFGQILVVRGKVVPLQILVVVHPLLNEEPGNKGKS